ncbi:FtsK/SpoIIIE family DNA translocase [Rhodopirellula sp. MGV]|uniref:FtsK/SpoIIIE family DNA translocase n=1 Tax=Rhodopirellula sp. MGV TaxID=2023130 RepID=UPI000B97B339|nr:DNA translocase FtsK [Rhodopirellula sp. MGV]OYP37905.1 DNA translocase FtsK [Rhodopirellula sp. MGV]PNY37082.1 DNA translocase FtsK [Rhodopirellula baltica]
MSADLINESNAEPDFARDVGSILLIALTILLTISLATRNPSDPIDAPFWPISQIHVPDVLVYPPAESIHNACGYWGALIASAMMHYLGLASAFVIAACGGVSIAMLRRGHLKAPVLRSMGGTVIVAAVATATAMMPIESDGLSVYGAGGVLGAMISSWLLDHFSAGGAWILTLTMLSVGTLLTTDYAILYATKKIFAGGAQASRAGMERAASAMPPMLRPKRKPFEEAADQLASPGDDGKKNKSNSEPAAAAEPVVATADSEATAEEETQEEEKPEPRIKLRSSGRRKKPKETEPAEIDEADTEPDAEAEDSAEEYAEYEEEYEDESSYREIEVEGETQQLRQDPEHSVPGPKIRMPKRNKTESELDKVARAMVEQSPAVAEEYMMPPIELLEASDDIDYEEQLNEVRRKAKILEATFADFGFNIRVVEIETGPVIAQYEIELEAGLRLSKITGLAEDLAIALRVPSVRIVAPIPGKNTVGIEVPNEKRQAVRLRDVMEESDTNSLKMNIPVFLGKDVSGNPMVVDLAKMPHLLIAGRTGTGKSVCLNSIITSMLMTRGPDEVRMLMIDPKMVELSGYGKLPHLMHPVITDMRKAEAILAWAVEKMEERYSLLANVGVRHINSFNDLGRDEILRRLEIEPQDDDGSVPDKLPFIVIVADEMADLMMTAGKDVEQHIIRLAQKSRAVGIHLILATQKPTVDVITGLIKSNLPARLSFQVASKTDSRVVLDENGADKLLGNGDMLFLWPGTSTLIRGQGTYLSDEEIDAICAHCSMREQNFVGELMNLKVNEDEEGDGPSLGSDRPDIYDSAVEVIIREGRGSCSLLQRHLGIGYGRAAKLIDFMAEDGIVGDYNGSKARDVLLSLEQWHEMQGLDPPESDDDDDSAVTSQASDDEEDGYEDYDEEEYEDEDDEYEDVKD